MEKCWPLRLSWTFKNLSWVFPYCLKRAGFHWKFQLPKQPTIWMLSWDRKSTLVLIPFCNKVWEDRWILGLNMRFSKIATRLNVFTWAAAVLTGWKIPHCPFENGEQNQTEQKFDWRVYSNNFFWLFFYVSYQMEEKFDWKVHWRGADCLLQLQFHQLALVLRTTTLMSKFSRNWENQLLFPLTNWFIFEI